MGWWLGSAGKGVALAVLFGGPLSLAGPPQKNHFDDPQTCLTCHVTQHAEWQGSMMHYSAESPVFQAFELTTRKLTGRFGAHDRQNPTFCINCHSPTAAYRNEMLQLKKPQPSIELMSENSRQGVHCTMCHSVREPDLSVDVKKGALGDAIANAAFMFFPTAQWVGPTTSAPLPQANEYHVEGFWPEKSSSDYLRSSQFCGSCHNVHVPNTADTLTGQPFQRMENLFTEWQEGPYNSPRNPTGKVVSCQDCHMSLYGGRDASGAFYPPGTYPTAKIAKGFDVERKHALHAFTAASRALVDEPARFPNQDAPDKDSFGHPLGQEQRRAAMLGRAVELKLASLAVQSEGALLPIRLTLLNNGAGHRVPSGFSQEREMWLELRVTDSAGGIVYESGALRDQPHPETGEPKADGRVSDESLDDQRVVLEPSRLEVTSADIGADFNLRPFRQLGVPTFNNAFMRRRTDQTYERVHFFTHANHMDNARSLPMLQPIPVRYDVPLAAWLHRNPRYCGPLKVRARLLYRSLPPKLIRALIVREPTLLSETHLDRNRIVEMASAEGQVQACGLQPPAVSAVVSLTDQSFAFFSGGVQWLSFPRPGTFENAKVACAQRACRLPTAAQYDRLGLSSHARTPGDNHDQLWTQRWAADPPAAGRATTYFIGGGATRVQTVSDAELRLPHLCLCEGDAR
jgi:hypothetical protein